jgi:hypothetical protein
MRNRRILYCLIAALAVIVMTGTGYVGATVEEDEELAVAVAYDATNPVAPTVWAAAPPIDDGSPRAVVFFTDFEGNNGGGVGTLDWEWGTYAWSGAICGYTPAPPVGAYSGAAMWGTVLNDCYGNLGNNTSPCANADATDDSILSFTVDLSALGEAWLYWWEWPDINRDFDWAEVRVNGNVVWQNCTGGYVPPTAWLQQEVDISAYVGAPAVITFHFMASTVVERGGWWIDDLMVTDAQVPVELQSLTIE